MRILYDHQIFAIQRFGGISRLFVELMARLSAREGCRVSWYRGPHVDGHDASGFLPRLEAYATGSSRAARPSEDGAGLAAFAARGDAPHDVLHPTYYDLPVERMPPHRRLVVTVCDLGAERYLSAFPRFHAMIESKRRHIERADLLLCISEATRAELVERHRVDAERTLVTPLASSLGGVAPAAVPAGAPFLLYVGTRSKYKNFERLVEAFGRSRWLREQLRVVCFGGSGGFTEPEEGALRRNGVAALFRHVDGDDRTLRALYDRAAALVYTSRYEGFGLPPLEAMECGCPVVCGLHSSLPEVVGDAAQPFDVDSADDLAAAIRRVVEDRALRERLVARGRERARAFSWERTAELTLAGYRRALERDARGGP